MTDADPLDKPPLADHGADRYDYVETIAAPDGVVPSGPWFEALLAEPCPDCRANLFIRWAGTDLPPDNPWAWHVTKAHDDTCPTLAIEEIP